MRKLEINWERINEFLDMTGAERSRLTGISMETWSRIKNTQRSLPHKRIQEIAFKFGLTEAEMHLALLMLKDKANVAVA